MHTVKINWETIDKHFVTVKSVKWTKLSGSRTRMFNTANTGNNLSNSLTPYQAKKRNAKSSLNLLNLKTAGKIIGDICLSCGK
jgi:hypothetical protein